jgi:hypothetical protein
MTDVDDEAKSILDLHILHPQRVDVASVALLDVVLLCSTTSEHRRIATNKI